MSDRILNKPRATSGDPLPSVSSGLRPFASVRLRGWLICLALLLGLFGTRLYDLGQFAIGSSLYSYIVLIPFVSAYLISLKRRAVSLDGKSDWRGGTLFLALGILLLAMDYFQRSREVALAPADSLALSLGSFLAFLVGSLFVFFGASFVKTNAFALAFLVFIIPFPSPVEHGIEVFFQKASAEMAALLLTWSNVPMLREGVIFRLPGIVIEVAEECSGIRSSLVLFLVSLVGGAVLLRTLKFRVILAAAVIPLAIIRNGIRILTISLLCVHVSPEMIDSPIHHRGGPIFFALSLVPFFGLLVLFRKWEKKRGQAHIKNDKV